VWCRLFLSISDEAPRPLSLMQSAHFMRDGRTVIRHRAPWGAWACRQRGSAPAPAGHRAGSCITTPGASYRLPGLGWRPTTHVPRAAPGAGSRQHTWKTAAPCSGRSYACPVASSSSRASTPSTQRPACCCACDPAGTTCAHTWQGRLTISKGESVRLARLFGSSFGHRARAAGC